MRQVYVKPIIFESYGQRRGWRGGLAIFWMIALLWGGLMAVVDMIQICTFFQFTADIEVSDISDECFQSISECIRTYVIKHQDGSSSKADRSNLELCRDDLKVGDQVSKAGNSFECKINGDLERSESLNALVHRDAFVLLIWLVTLIFRKPLVAYLAKYEPDTGSV